MSRQYKTPITCLECGKSVIKRQYNKYCSPECKSVWRRKYRQQWYQQNKVRLNEKKQQQRELAREQPDSQDNVDLTVTPPPTLEK